MTDRPDPSAAGARGARKVLLTLLLLATPMAHAAEPADDSDTEAGDEAHAHEHEHDEHGPYETIVVTATPFPHDRDELAIPVDRIDRDELLQNLGSTLGETLTSIPGIATSGFAAGASRPVIRGQDAYRTEVLEDGLRTQDVSRESPDHAVPVNPLAARRVEVVRGPATLRYGGGASAGVVNVITNRVPDKQTGDAISGEVFGGIGLVANERDLAAQLDGSRGDFAWHADGLLRRQNDYAIPNDDKPHIQSGSEIEAWMGSVGTAYFHELGRLGFSYTRVENNYGIPEEDEPVEIDQTSDRFRFEGDLFPEIEGIREVRFRGVYSEYEHDEIADGSVGQTYRNDEFEGRLELLHETWQGFTGAFGIQGRARDFKAKGEAAEFLAPTDTAMFAAYFFEERQILDDLDLEMGFRAEYNRVDGKDATDTSRDRTFVPLSGSVALLSSPLDWLKIGTTVAISQRAPSQVELLARGAHEATATYEIGDPDLDEETSYTGEIRIVATHERGRLEWAAFATYYQDFIYAQLTGGLVDEDGNPAPGDPDALDELFYRHRDALFYGTEIAGELDLFELGEGDFGLEAQFDFVRARFTSGNDRDVPRITPIRWGASLFYASDVFDARFGFLRTEPQNKISSTETATNSFTYLNASMVFKVDLVEAVPVELSIVGRNLTDVRGRNHVSFNKDAVIQPGRSIRFGLRARF